MDVAEKPEVCPNCGFSPVGTIVYGPPCWNDEQRRGLEDGSIIPGGCCIYPGRVEWACKNCGCEFKLRDEAVCTYEE